MTNYSYSRCLTNSHKVNWRIDEVLADRSFDLDRRWLPSALSAADRLDCLDETERRKLTHIEMASYAHLFGYVEEFIAPQVVELSADFEHGDRRAFEALTNFAAEEIKHMHLFRRLRDQLNATLGFELRLVDGEHETARFVLGKSTGAVLLLTACIEWLTQRHYLECFKSSENLDPFTKHVFKAHWQEEAQHAQLDHLETLRSFGSMTPDERELAVQDLIQLVEAVDGLLAQQAAFDTENFERYIRRTLFAEERAQVLEQVLSAKRDTFLISGVTHPRFQELFAAVTTAEQQERVGAALGSLLPRLAAA